MNAQENIIDTLHVLDGSNQLLRANASLLVQLAKHSVHGEEICAILDGIQVQQNKIIDIANGLMSEYEKRYNKEMTEVDSLAAELMDEVGGKDAR